MKFFGLYSLIKTKQNKNLSRLVSLFSLLEFCKNLVGALSTPHLTKVDVAYQSLNKDFPISSIILLPQPPEKN